jgi:hypothetical protein
MDRALVGHEHRLVRAATKLAAEKFHPFEGARAIPLGAAALIASASLALAPQPATAAPPTLAQLEATMGALAPTSVQLSLAETISGETAPAGPFGAFGSLGKNASRRRSAHSAKTETVLTLSGAVSSSPPLANFTGAVLGFSVGERQIGSTRWNESGFVGSLDGNRPWVEERNQPVTGSKSLTNVAATSFRGVVEDLRLARGLHEVGPQLADGIATREFEGQIPRRELAAANRSAGGIELEALSKLVHGSIELHVYIAEDGVPVRTAVGFRLATHSHHALLVAQTDTPAIDVPVVVSPPPASETITKAQLEHLLAPKPVHHSHHKKRR